MLHQVQFYDPADFQAAEKRRVIATVDGLATQDAVNEWQAKVLTDTPVPDGMQSFCVAGNSPWFIGEDSNVATLATPNVADTGNNGETGEVEMLGYDKVGPQQLKIDEERRLAEIERQERLAAHMAQFEATA